MSVYRPCYYTGQTILLEQYLILRSQPCPEENYNLFSISPHGQLPDYTVPDFALSSYDCLDELSREQSNTFRRHPELAGHCVCLYAQVICRNAAKVIVNLMCYKGKLWVNGRCLAVNSVPFDGTKYMTVTLKKGMNHFVFEQWVANENTNFYIQLRNYELECGQNLGALSNMSHVMQLDPLVLIQDPSYLPDQPEFRFMYMKNDNMLSREFRVEVHDSKAGLLYTCCGELDRPVTIGLNRLRALGSETLRHAWVRCIFLDQNGNELVTGPNIVVTNFLPRAEEINEKLSRIMDGLPPEAYCRCRRILELSRGITDEAGFLSKYWLACQGEELLSRLEAGDYQCENIYTPGVHEVLFQSELDTAVISVNVYVPQHYDRDRAYPVVVGLSTSSSTVYAHLFAQMMGEEFLYLDATGRGFTGGSYIGEASTLEVLEWLRKHYKIDEDRLYLIGYSNGAIAAYALAQTHPELAAGIYPDAGIPQLEALENLSNVPVYTFVSPKDYVYIGRENEAQRRLFKYHNYHQYELPEMLHTHFYFYLFHRKLFQDLTAHKRSCYPARILYRTSRNRHLQSFWIRLHGIAEGKKTARVKAELAGTDRIMVTAANTGGLTITVPEQIDRSRFSVSINGCSFDFSDCWEKELHFEHKRGWRQCAGSGKIDARKGTGILDVYLGSMRIILPESPSAEEEKIARTFSKPDTNGADPQVSVCYPVYRASDVPAHIFSHHLVLVDRDGRNHFSAQLQRLLPVKYDAAGFDYQGERYEGSYIILQVMANPYDSQRSILNISFNDTVALRKFLPIRKLVLPTYINGLHPYFNNEVLIFHDGKYYGAYEEGGALLPL